MTAQNNKMTLIPRAYLDPQLIHGDAFKLVHDIKANAIQMTVTSPPYNVGKSYEIQVDLHDYLHPIRTSPRSYFELQLKVDM